MLPPPVFASMLSIGIIVMSGQVSGQDYPNRPIRFVTSEPGGGTDFAARLIAHEIATGLGQNVVVENRPSNLVGAVVAKAPPDGHTIVVATDICWVGPLLQKTAYDPLIGFSPITSPVISPSVVVVHPSLKVRSIKDLISLAKARPGELNYGSTGTGGTSHLGAELFKSMGDVDIVWVPYKGGGPALNALIGGPKCSLCSRARLL